MIRRIWFVTDLDNITFTAQRTYPTGDGSLPVSLAVTDVNADNQPDIIVANQLSHNIGVLLNDGQGTFLPQITYSVGIGSHPQHVSVNDIDDDDIPDIFVAMNGANGFGILINDGDGTFFYIGGYRTGENSYPPSLAVADVNNDNNLDVIIANQNENNIGVLLFVENFGFSNQTRYPPERVASPTSPSVADINDDNNPDIIFASYDGDKVGILFGKGDGTFPSWTTYSTETNSRPIFVSVADLNQDDKLDIVVANSNTNNIGILLNSGNGTFLSQVTFSTGNNSHPRCVSLVDLNGDNKPEIIVANQNDDNIGIFVNYGNGQFILEKTYLTGVNSKPQFVSVVDVNGDTKPDIIIANSETSNVGVMLAV